jgi:hypothetical protein
MGTVRPQVSPSSPKNPPGVNRPERRHHGPGEQVVTSASDYNRTPRARRVERRILDLLRLRQDQGGATPGEILGYTRGLSQPCLRAAERDEALSRLLERGAITRAEYPVTCHGVKRTVPLYRLAGGGAS